MFSVKFGGTSMGSEQSIKNVIKIIEERKKKKLVVTVSAMSGVTNKLLRLANKAIQKGKIDTDILKEIKQTHQQVCNKFIQNPQILQNVNKHISKELKKLKYFLEAIAITSELSTKSHDIIMAIGEKLSAYMLASILNSNNIKAKYVNLENLVKKNYPEPNHEYFKKAETCLAKELKKHLKEKAVPVCTGFFGKIPGGILESVGRGYSDFTCALAGAGLKVKEIQIWTDVDGMFSADPRIVKEAHIIDKLSFKEASELAHFGAKILHPQTIHPAVEARIPVRVLNTFNLKNVKGTVIVPTAIKSKHRFKSIAVKKNNTIIRICSSRMMMHYGFMAKIFEIFNRYKLSIDLITTSEVNVSLSFKNDVHLLQDAVKELKELGTVYVYPNNTIISIVGQEITQNTNLSSTVFGAIEKSGIDIKLISQGASQINLSFVVADKKADKVLKIVHQTVCKKTK